jgi:hypothetical protein
LRADAAAHAELFLSVAPVRALVPEEIMVRPIDALLRDYVSGPARAAGFRKRARNYLLGEDAGDLAGFGFQGSSAQFGNAEFYLGVGLSPSAWRDWCDARGNPDYPFNPTMGAGAGLNARLRAPEDVTAPGEFGPVDRFIVEAEEARWRSKGAALGRYVTDIVIPNLAGYLDSRLAPDLCYGQRGPMARFGDPWWRFFVLLGNGPSRDLGETWERLEDSLNFGDETQAWVKSWLTDNVTESDAEWAETTRHDWWQPARRAELQLLDALSGSLSRSGFVLADGALRCANDLGDEVVVEIRPGTTSSDEQLVFSVEAAIVPIMRWRYRREMHMKARRKPSCREGWKYRRLKAPDGWTHTETTSIAYDLEQWATPTGRVAECAATVIGELGPVIDELREYLDRRRLSDVLGIGPGSDRLSGERAEVAVLLSLDTDPRRAQQLLPDTTMHFKEWAETIID